MAKAKSPSGPAKTAAKKGAKPSSGATAKYPRHALTQALRIPRAILEQNAGQECTEKEAANFIGVALGGALRLEISSATKYGLLSRPSPGKIAITPLAKRILRPQNPQDELSGLREAILNAPDLSAVYKHYRGENLPDSQFFHNALVDKFAIPAEKVSEFSLIFLIL